MFTDSATCKGICTDFVQNQIKLVTCRTATESEQLQSDGALNVAYNKKNLIYVVQSLTNYSDLHVHRHRAFRLVERVMTS